MIFIEQDIKYRPIDIVKYIYIEMHSYSCAIETTLNNITYSIIKTYRPSGADFNSSLNHTANLMNNCTQRYCNILFCGDIIVDSLTEYAYKDMLLDLMQCDKLFDYKIGKFTNQLQKLMEF